LPEIHPNYRRGQHDQLDVRGNGRRDTRVPTQCDYDLSEERYHAVAEECGNNSHDHQAPVRQEPPRLPCNPFASAQGENLPPHLVRNWANFLIQPMKALPASCFDSFELSQVSRHLQEHAVIASFVGGVTNEFVMNTWLQDLDQLLYPNHIVLHKLAGGSFHYLKLDCGLAVQKTPNLRLHQFSGGEVSYHQWQPAFNLVLL